MSIVYVLVFAVIGMFVLGPAGGVLGLGLGAVFAATQVNHRKIRRLEERLDEKE